MATSNGQHNTQAFSTRQHGFLQGFYNSQKPVGFEGDQVTKIIVEVVIYLYTIIDNLETLTYA